MERKSTPGKTPQSERDARLKAALKANLGRRKAQARARATEPGDKTEQTDKSSGNKD
ncbi:hypothetical protein ACN2XU_07540 [Primorskyibacter sp. 2E107]